MYGIHTHTRIDIVESCVPLLKFGQLVPSDAPNLLQATCFAFLAAAIFLPNEHCAKMEGKDISDMSSKYDK